MNTAQLTTCLNRDACIRPIFAGVYAINRLPFYIDKRPSLYVVNSDFAENVGQHWFCVYFDRDCRMTCEFWDSFGRHPSCYHKYLTEFLDRNCSHLLYNDRVLQSDTTSVCGHYVLYFAYFKARHVPMEGILTGDHFGLDTGLNDLRVYNFSRKYFSLP